MTNAPLRRGILFILRCMNENHYLSILLYTVFIKETNYSTTMFYIEAFAFIELAHKKKEIKLKKNLINQPRSLLLKCLAKFSISAESKLTITEKSAKKSLKLLPTLLLPSKITNKSLKQQLDWLARQ